MGWDFLDDSDSGYLKVEFVGPNLEWDCLGLMCFGTQYFLGFVSGSELADYKLDTLDFRFVQCPLGLGRLMQIEPSMC